MYSISTSNHQYVCGLSFSYGARSLEWASGSIALNFLINTQIYARESKFFHIQIIKSMTAIKIFHILSYVSYCQRKTLQIRGKGEHERSSTWFVRCHCELMCSLIYREVDTHKNNYGYVCIQWLVHIPKFPSSVLDRA